MYLPMLGMRYPFQSLHEMNLDWLLNTMKELVNEWNVKEGEFNSYQELVEAYFTEHENQITDYIATADALIAANSDAFDALQTYVTNYFAALDISAEVNTIFNTLIANGTIAAIVENYIASNYDSLSGSDLLLNGDFAALVNQRGTTSYAEGTSQYTIDGWIKGADCSLSVGADRVTVAASGAATDATMFMQKVPNYLPYRGKAVTASIITGAMSGSPISLVIADGVGVSSVALGANGVYSVTRTIDAAATFLYVYLLRGVGTTMSIEAKRVSLEPGNVSTIEKMPHNDKVFETTKCRTWLLPLMDYFMGMGACTSTTGVSFMFQFPVKMRVAPTLIRNSTGLIVFDGTGGGSAQTVVNPPYVETDGNGAMVGFADFAGLVQFRPVRGAGHALLGCRCSRSVCLPCY